MDVNLIFNIKFSYSPVINLKSNYFRPIISLYLFPTYSHQFSFNIKLLPLRSPKFKYVIYLKYNITLLDVRHNQAFDLRICSKECVSKSTMRIDVEQFKHST